jgi:predicted nucleic acid-binding protein
VNVYLDTSALLKLFLTEEHAEQVRSLVGRADRVLTSLISWPEARTGLARAARSNRISEAWYPVAISELTVFWEEAHVTELTSRLAFRAGDLGARFFLRGFDAIHLASALESQDSLRSSIRFVSFDNRLLSAAEESGLDAWRPG